MHDTHRQLFQFPLSLYCEKSAWTLDAKALAYDKVNLVPGPQHMLTAWRLAGIRTLPVLRDGNACVGDSTAIALHLEAMYPVPALLPADPRQREDVLALEARFDETGDHVRRCVWSLAVDSPRVHDIFFRGYGKRITWLEKLLRPILRLMIRRTFDVYPEPVNASWGHVMQALDALEHHLSGDASRYLVGDCFTLADLAAAAMLAPLIGPEESPWPDHHVTEQHSVELRRQFRDRVAGEWVLRIYREHRQRPCGR